MPDQSAAFAALAALGDSMRRDIFVRLSAGPLAVGVLAETLPITRPAVSQHLRVLREAGLVAECVQGARRIYRIDPRGIGAMRDWLDQHWASALGAFKTYADGAP